MHEFMATGRVQEQPNGFLLDPERLSQADDPEGSQRNDLGAMSSHRHLDRWRHHHRRYDVIVVGGGPVGIATAIELGVRGALGLVGRARRRCGPLPDRGIHRHRVDGTAAPLGYRGAVLHSGFPQTERRDISFVSRMTTHELARFPVIQTQTGLDTTRGLSPRARVVPKFWFDPTFAARARRRSPR